MPWAAVSAVHAIDLQKGDIISGELVTQIDKTGNLRGYIRVWTNNRFVPKCYRPMDHVDIS